MKILRIRSHPIDLPTLADSTLFMAISHEAMHLGQLAAWRRGQGLPSAMLELAKRRRAERT